LSTLKQFGRESLIYGIGYISIRAVSFLLLPFFTNIFTKEEFGVYALIFTFIAFLQVFYSYGLDSALLKYYVKKGEDKEAICTSVFVSLTVSALIISAFLWVFSDTISQFLLRGAYSNYIKISSLILFFDAFTFRIMIIIRANNQFYRYLFITMLNIIITVCANLIFVSKYNMGVLGSLYGTFIASFITLTFVSPSLFQSINIKKYSFIKLKMLLRFALPIFPAIILKIVMDMSDRYILLWMTNSETVGVYSASYKIGSLMLFLVNGFQLGWDPCFLKKENDINAPFLFSKISLYFTTFLLAVWIFFVLFIDRLIQIRIFNIHLIGEEFWEGSHIIPIIMLGYVFLGFYNLLMPGIYFSGKTKLLSLYRGIGAFINIVLNIVLIPKFGAMGAGIATAISFGLMIIPLYFRSNKLFHIPFQWNLIIGFFIFGLMIYLSNSFYNFSILTSIFIYFIYLLSGVAIIRENK
jgi:O-antigen/teichoic acid export membrane protein